MLISQGSARRESQALFQRLWGTGSYPQSIRVSSCAQPRIRCCTCRTRQESTAPHADACSMHSPKSTRRSTITSATPRFWRASLSTRWLTECRPQVPGLVDLSDEPDSTFKLYGEDARQPGTFAANCLQARRLAERDVRFIQLYHRGWDQHGDLPSDLKLQCRDVDRASAALITDLEQRGLLDDTLVVWGGEFGPLPSTARANSPTPTTGRDHHGRCFTVFMAGAGVTPGMSYGTSDDFGYNITSGGVHVHDLNATILHLMGIDHERLTHHHQGRDFRLTDVHGPSGSGDPQLELVAVGCHVLERLLLDSSLAAAGLRSEGGSTARRAFNDGHGADFLVRRSHLDPEHLGPAAQKYWRRQAGGSSASISPLLLGEFLSLAQNTKEVAAPDLLDISRRIAPFQQAYGSCSTLRWH